MHLTVERLSYLHETEIVEFINEIKHTMRPWVECEASAVRQALSLVRNSAIGPYSLTNNEDEFKVDINEITPVQVRISFRNIGLDCTCESDDWCSHRIAVIFHLYSQFHSLTDWHQEWRRTESQQMALSISERTPDAWIQTLTRLTNPLRSIGFNENPGVFIHESSLMDQKSIPLVPFEWEWKPLFELYYRIHVLDAGWAYANAHLGEDKPSFIYGKWYIQNWLAEQLGKLKDSVITIGAKPKLFETDAFYSKIRDIVRKFSLHNEGLFDDRFTIYRLFWQNLYPLKPAQRVEMTHLANEDSNEAFIFIAFFNLLQGNHEEIVNQVNTISEETVAQWLAFARFAESMDDTDTLQIIMRALLPFIGEYIKHSVPISNRPSFARNIDGLFEAANVSEDERESMFSHYGEAGIDVYADFLVERERFAEWAALMHRYGVSYENAEAGGLKIALSIEPAAVFPLLHIYATGFIKDKNRHSYRRAVKIFKKMKAGSKKSGKTEFWNQYIDTVREKNRRLRALVEEMEKGNLNL